MKALTLRSLERLRAVAPEGLRHLADAKVARAHAVAILRDDADAAAEFGSDAGAVARLAAILRHDFGGAPIGLPEAPPETDAAALNDPDLRSSGRNLNEEPLTAPTRLSLDAAGARLGLPFGRLALMEAEPLTAALRDAGLDPRRDGRVVTLDAAEVARLAADRDAGCALALSLAGRIPSLCHFSTRGVALQ
jgi:hypothetical protein